MMDRTIAKIGRSIKNFEKSMICLFLISALLEREWG
jgi:hypothetical protein